jgi:hypothetical protein
MIKGVTPLLKDKGFKKKHHTFLKSDTKDYVIDFQLSKYNIGIHTDFFINFGLHDQTIDQTEIKTIWDCLIAKRIYSIKKEKDDKIILDENDTAEELIIKISKGFQDQVFKFYDDHKTTEAIVDYLINETGLAKDRQVFTYLFKTNQIDKVEVFTKNILSLLGQDSRTEKIMKGIHDIGQNFGHNFDYKKLVTG